MKSTINKKKILTEIDFNIHLESEQEIDNFQDILCLAEKMIYHDGCKNMYANYDKVSKLINKLKKIINDAKESE
jgi:hypothetical protein